MFGKNVDEILKMKGMKQKDLAELSGTTPAQISRYIYGQMFPRLDTAKRIADALGCDLTLLIKDAEDPDQQAETKDKLISMMDAINVIGKKLSEINHIPEGLIDYILEEWLQDVPEVNL